MAVRNESVRLSLQDDFTSGMAKAAAATALLDRNLNSLSGSAVRSDREVAKVDKTIGNAGRNADSSGKQIDKLSGRLALLAQAAAVLGPALVPLGAPLVGVMAGLTAQLGAVAGAIGVSVLAFNGMGDALKAVNEYQLEPTAENLQAMRIEMEKLGLAGADFVRFIDDLGPQIKTLQLTAREGLLPGVEEGITNLLPLLPKVRNIIGDLASAMGGLAGDAGADLAGPEWRSFFDYLDNEAGPLLVEFGNTVGNFAQGFAGLMVGLAPVTRDFSGGLEAMSESFANWSANLGANKGFQEFIQYVQESGPKAVDFLGELASTFASILKAAAPVGDVVLPVLTSLVDIIGDLADSPLGPLFFTAAAAMSVYSRAVSLGVAATARFGAAATTTAAGVTASSTAYRRAAVGAQFLADNYRQVAAAGGMMALSMTDVDDKMGLSNTAMLTLAGSMAGPWGAAAGAAVGVTMDLAAANDDLDTAVRRAQSAMESGDASQMREEMARLEAQIRVTEDTLSTGFFSMDKPKQMFTGLTESLGIFGSTSDDARAKIDELAATIRTNRSVQGILADQLGMTAQQFRVAAGGAQEFSGALASMAGWLDKRAALRAYQEELTAFGKALENGFQPKNVEGLDRVAEGILQVASQIKNVEVRKDFMANARQSLEEFAATGPKARAAVDKVIDQFEKLGLMKPKPKVDVDTKSADDKVDQTGRKVAELNKKKAAPKVSVPGASDAISTMDRLAAELSGLPREVVSNIRINTYRNTINTQSGPAYNAGGIPGSAEGGTIPKTGLPYADRHHYLLADGEEVISNRNGQADRHRGLLKAINAGRLAVGGTAGIDGWSSVRGGGDNWSGYTPGLKTFDDNLRLTGEFLRNDLRERIKEAKQRQDEGKQRLDMLRQEKAALTESVTSLLRGDIFAKQEGSTVDASSLNSSGGRPEGMSADEWNRIQQSNLDQQRMLDSFFGQTASPTDQLRESLAQAREMSRLIKELRRKGFRGPLLQELIQSGNLEQMRVYAAGSAGDIRELMGLNNQVNQQVAQTANVASQAVGLNSAIKAQAAEQRQTNQRLQQIEKKFDALTKAAAEDGPDRTGRKVADALQDASARGSRRR